MSLQLDREQWIDLISHPNYSVCGPRTGCLNHLHLAALTWYIFIAYYLVTGERSKERLIFLRIRREEVYVFGLLGVNRKEGPHFVCEVLSSFLILACRVYGSPEHKLPRFMMRQSVVFKASVYRLLLVGNKLEGIFEIPHVKLIMLDILFPEQTRINDVVE